MSDLEVRFVMVWHAPGNYEWDAMLVENGYLAAVGRGRTRQEAEAKARQKSRQDDDVLVIIDD